MLGTRSRKVSINTNFSSYNIEMVAGSRNVFVKKKKKHQQQKKKKHHLFTMLAMVIACCLILRKRESVTSLYIISAAMQPFSGEKLML